ncbi:hypothetical protein HU720_08155 [Pseudomonas sp. SWRI51]|uniref:DUF6950 family protein n=1 Tax=Pseudomonas sp. SWRI51 TaxID=2745491 RepID=UPI0016455C9A|nr:hypothetical protein [Pseudomonas sp. SWRI51]MBC3411275.1 hypothetical protein [Pseudomonas sp. SWRI51]
MRNRNWTTQLAHTIKAATERPFSWGEFDCCLFAADCSMAICGVDPAASYRGRYTTETGAKRLLKRNHGSLEGAWDACFSRVEPAFTQRGDVALYDGPNGRGVAVYWAGDFWSASEEGVGRIDCAPLVVWRIE